MKRLNLLLLIIPVALILSACQNHKTEVNIKPFPYTSFKIMRGTNIAHWLSQSKKILPKPTGIISQVNSALLIMI
jgi:hypothetical protein